MSKVEEFFSNLKSDPITFEDIKEKVQMNALLNKKKTEAIVEEVEEERKIKIWVIILAIIGVVAIGCVVGYLIYRKRKPDYFADFEDDYEADDIDDDLFEDE